MSFVAAASVAGLAAYFIGVPRHMNQIVAKAGPNPGTFAQAMREYIQELSYPREDPDVFIIYNGAIPEDVNQQLVCQAPANGKRQAGDICTPAPSGTTASLSKISTSRSFSTNLPTLTKECSTSSLVGCQWIYYSATSCPTTTQVLPASCSTTIVTSVVTVSPRPATSATSVAPTPSSSTPPPPVPTLTGVPPKNPHAYCETSKGGNLDGSNIATIWFEYESFQDLQKMNFGAVFAKDYSFHETPSTRTFGAAPFVWKAQVEVQFSWATMDTYDKDRKQISDIMKKAQPNLEVDACTAVK
jgi:hypothetical protein